MIEDDNQCGHLLCGVCFRIVHLGWMPAHSKGPTWVYCCRCGNRTVSSVVYAHIARRFPCAGEHPYAPFWERTDERADAKNGAPSGE